MKIQGTKIRGLKLYSSAATVDADSYFNLVTLLLPGNGTNGSQNNTFLDSSTNNLSITRNGNPTQGTFSPFSQTGWSNYFDGTSDYLQLSESTAFSFGTGNFTIEAFVYLTTTQSFGTIFLSSTGGLGDSLHIQINSANKVRVTNETTEFLLATNAIPLNTWTHIAVTRSGTTLSIWQDGVSNGSTTNNTSFTANGSLIGYEPVGGNFYYAGYISNLRVVKGTAVYTSAFTTPTSPLTAIADTSLLTCQSNRFVDNSGNNFVITVPGNINQQINNTAVQAFSPFDPTTSYSTSTVGGSGYFDGSGDWLTVVNSVLNYGTSDFSLEFWVYPTTQGAGTYWWSDGSSDSLGYYSDAADQWRVYLGTSAGSYNIFLGNNLTGTRRYQWNHIVLCRNGTTVSIFVNGTRVATNGSVSGSMTLTNNTYQLMSQSTSAAAGYMFGFRTVIGSYVYDATQTSITLPTAPPTAVSNTKFLCNFTNGGITDATAKNVLETVGGAAISTTQSKFGGSSMLFDGSGDYLVTPAQAITNLTGDFTVEFWAYRPSAGNNFFYTTGDDALSSGIAIYIGNSGNNLRVYNANGVVIDAALSGISFPTSTWTHIALVRSSGVVKLFVAGSQAGSNWSSSTTFSGRVYLATEFNNGSAGGTGNCYLQDFRITRGYARYTATFTPPTAAFPTQ